MYAKQRKHNMHHTQCSLAKYLQKFCIFFLVVRCFCGRCSKGPALWPAARGGVTYTLIPPLFPRSSAGMSPAFVFRLGPTLLPFIVQIAARVGNRWRVPNITCYWKEHRLVASPHTVFLLLLPLLQYIIWFQPLVWFTEQIQELISY